jgi:hypothetical protein
MWESAEEPLRSMASADVLAVLDCCFASTAAVKSSGNQTRAYQLLAASSKEGLTSEPGEDSFTTALCDTLEELLRESPDRTFPLIKLHGKINQKHGKESFLWDRLKQLESQTWGKIALGRLAPNSKRCESFQNKEQERASLTLRISLKTDNLEDDVVEKLAGYIPKACEEAGLHVRGVDWVRFGQRDHHIIREVVERFQRRVSASKKRKRSPIGGLEHQRQPRTRSQPRYEGSLLAPPERELREGSATSDEFVDSGLHTPPRRSVRGRPTAGDTR